MKLRKLFAGVAAAATLLGGMAFGATTANAADTASITLSGDREGYRVHGVQDWFL